MVNVIFVKQKMAIQVSDCAPPGGNLRYVNSAPFVTRWTHFLNKSNKQSRCEIIAKEIDFLLKSSGYEAFATI